MTEQQASTSYAPGKLVLTLVPREQGDTVMHVAKAAGARGGTIVLGHTTVENKLMQFLGLDNTESEMVYTLLSHAEYAPVIEAISKDEHIRKLPFGLLIGLDVNGILRHMAPALAAQVNFESEKEMSTNASHELISVIVNTGFAGEVMDAARKAGAPGGTILNARGTGREEDVKFFGISIVPEKEFLLIVVPKDQADSIMEAIRQSPCLNEPGIGIAFRMDVESFAVLGKKALAQ